MLAASHLTRHFGDRVAVRDLTFEITRGEIVALLGPNGAGKTTTLRMLAGLIEPTAGEVHLDGQRVERGNAARLRAHVGFLTEAPGLWERLTVQENLLTYARLYGLQPASAAVDRVLDTLGIADRRDDSTAELSKGLKQRVALARALLHNPDIVLLDEPTSGLDPESARDVRALLVGLRGEGRAVLLSTHNLDEVERIADRIAVLRTCLLALDTPEALRTRTFRRKLRISLRGDAESFARLLRSRGFDADAEGTQLSIAVAASAPATSLVDTPQVVRTLVENHAEIERVTTDEPSLEDTYLGLMEAPTDA